jgi:hypothetical protein
VSDGDRLQRSMDAAPGEWLDRLVTDRVMTEVRRQEAAAHAEGRWCSARAVAPLSRWLVALRQHAIVVGFLGCRALKPTAIGQGSSTSAHEPVAAGDMSSMPL